MKIRIIIPNTSPAFFNANAPVRQTLATDDMQISVVNLTRGPASIEGGYDDVFAGPGVLEQAAIAEREGFDAIVLDCASDPALRACRELVSIPVVGAGEASHLAACMLCNKFSIITALPVSSILIGENIEKYGLRQRVASLRCANVPVLDLEDEEKAEKKILLAAKAAIEHDGAEAILLGCTGMIAMRMRLEEPLGVPVIEPITAGVHMAASLVRMGLRHSKIAYETPTEKIRT